MADVSQSVLLTDLYQLTMLQGYHQFGMDRQATFEMFVRQLPAGRNFLVAAGLEQVLEYLESLRFTDEEVCWLRETGRFQESFLEFLSELQFTGDVHAMPEGTVFFADEPLIRVTAPLPQAQLVESRIINLLQFQTLIASKAVRAVLAAAGRPVVDFGMRRAHGAEAALLAARAAYMAGFAGTATVLAGRQFGIPLFGTMAHSYVLAHRSEREAFEHFAAANPGNVVLLLDTYDVDRAARLVVEMARSLQNKGIAVQGVRLDSGDFAAQARRIRHLFDENGLHRVKVFASGNLDERRVAELVGNGAPIDAFGIGTRLDVSDDAPYLECAYKLQSYAGRPCRKRSEGKATWPGIKQVFRQSEGECMVEDVITLDGDEQPGEQLLVPAMAAGRPLISESLETIRKRVAQQLDALPPALRSLDDHRSYPVTIAPAIIELARRLDEEHASRSP